MTLLRHRAETVWRAGQVVGRPVDWPLIGEEGSPPRIHHPAGQPTLNSIRGCTLTGPGLDFRAVLSGPLPALG